MSLRIPHLPVAASCAALFFGARSDAAAHGSLHEQIAAITTALETKPADPGLLILRAGLHRAHMDWDAAILDIAAAENAGASPGALALVRTEVAVARLDWDAAVRELPVLKRDLPHNADAWRLAARVHSARGENAEAVAAWRIVIGSAVPQRPDDTLLLARALHATGADDEAIATLDPPGRIVVISVFLEEAARIEEARRRWDPALTLLDRLIAQGASVRWLARKAEIADRAARPNLAAASRRAAIEALEALPPARRTSPALIELERTLRNGGSHKIQSPDSQ